MGEEQNVFRITRMKTGVPGLDQVLGGGFLVGSCNLIVGSAGTGKTILGSQMAFAHVRGGGRALYMTLLTETHSRMLAHLSTMTYFDPATVGDGLYVVSGTKELSARGFKGLSLAIRKALRQQRATLLVLDGLTIMEDGTHSGEAILRFLRDLNTLVDLIGCTVVILATTDPSATGPERAIVDSVLWLQDEVVGRRSVRALRVVKLRGSSHARGFHSYDIDRHGVHVYARFEGAAAGRRVVPLEVPSRVSTGAPGLDAMLMGGVVEASTTLVLGAPGSGKTLLGLSFLAAGAEAGENGLHYGFYESPPRLVARGEAIGLPLHRLVEEHKLCVHWRAPVEQSLDEVVHHLFVALKRSGAKRLFLDGLDALHIAAAFPDRLPTFFTALGNALRARGITTFISGEAALFGPEVDVPIHGVSAAVENIFLLKYVEYNSRILRILSILKVRESDYDSSLRELKITPHGIEVAPALESAEAILSGYARETPPPPPAPFGMRRRTRQRGGLR